MVQAAVNLSPEQLSTKALAAAGQFRAIALWLNEPLISQGIYAQVQQDKRPGCILITVEFQRLPSQERLVQFICHLIWQLNSPLIEGIHLVARPIGTPKSLWEQRVRVMTPALKERLRREQGQGPLISPIPPAIAPQRSRPLPTGLPFSLLFSQQLKTLRAFMLTGSAVAAFVLGCMIEVVLSSRPEPSLPFQAQRTLKESPRSPATWQETHTAPTKPQLPTFQRDAQPVLTDHTADPAATATPSSAAEVTPVSYKVEPERDRPNVVNAALEPVGVIAHERVPHPQDPTVTLLFGGDLTLDGLPYQEYEETGHPFGGFAAYQTADIAMVNLQDPLAAAATSLEEELIERERPEAINLLKAGGVDIVNLTGEDILAFGEQGLDETLNTLDRNGVYRVGAGRNEREARRPEIMDVKGQRIAYLSYDRADVLAAYDTVGGVNAASMADIIKDIRAIRDEVDWLVVNYRWTEEVPEKPAESQTNLARLAIDQGADLVVGHHPSQIQGAEIYKGRPIAYSLGDFELGQSVSEPLRESAVLQVAIREGQMKVDLIPVTVKNGQLQVATDADADLILNKIQQASQTFNQPMPPSVVLEAGSLTAPDAPARPDGSFTTPETTPLATPEAERFEQTSPATPKNGPIAPATLPHTAPLEASPDGSAADDDTLYEIEMEPIPEGLLDNWGPKDDAGAVEEPESLLPGSLRFRQPKRDREKPRKQPATPAETNRSPVPKVMPAPPAVREVEPDVITPQDAIAPYSEPLVGPLSALPTEDASPMNMQPSAISSAEVAIAPQAFGMPQTRIYKPLNFRKPETEKVVTVDVVPDAISYQQE